MATFAEQFRADRASGSTGVKLSNGSSFAARFHNDIGKQLEEEARKRKEEEARRQQEEIQQRADAETKKYLEQFNEASSGFFGSVLKRFGKGADAPVIDNVKPAFEQAYSEAQKYAKENKNNQTKSFGKNLAEGTRNVLTENTAQTLYDTIYQSKVDKKNLDVIENNTKLIVQLHNRNKDEPNGAFRLKRQQAIDALVEQNHKLAEEAGGEIKDKTTKQLIGQSVLTALELTQVPGFGAGMTQAGKFILAQGTKQALRALGKEAAVYGFTAGAAGAAKDNATAGDIVKSGVLGAGIATLTVMSPSLARLGAKEGDALIKRLTDKLTGKVADDLTPEETTIAKEIAQNSPEVKKMQEEAAQVAATPSAKTATEVAPQTTTTGETTPPTTGTVPATESTKTVTPEPAKPGTPTSTPEPPKKIEEAGVQFLAKQGDTQSKPYKEFNKALEEANIENGYGYKKETNKEQVDAVKSLIENESESEAFKVALKIKDKEGVLNSATNIVLERTARDAGNEPVANMLKLNRLRQQTRNAKELQAENISKETTANRYLRKIISDKMKEVIGSTESKIVKTLRGNKSENEVFDKVVSQEAKKLKTVVEKRKLAVKDVQKMIDDLICK